MKDPYSRTKFTSLVVASLALAWFAVSPHARAVCQEGCDIANGNTFLGDDALINVTFGAGNIAIGPSVLYNNTTGANNTAVGWQALRDNITGYNNTAIGVEAMLSNVDGTDNTAIGVGAMIYASGNNNTAIGMDAMEICSGDNNTATGHFALNYNTGTQNTAMGKNALVGIGPGSNNTAIGYSALQGSSASNNNIAVGSYAGSEVTTGGNNIDIGNRGAPADNKTIRIGVAQTQRAAFIAGISGATVPGGIGVVIDSSGHLGTVTSSARYKDAIKPMDKSSEVILSLKPVSFRYKKELDPQGISQFGLVAEEVAKVDPDLVARDEAGKPYTVRYEAVNAMLLNEFLKEHHKVEELEAKVQRLEKAIGR